MSEVLSPKPDEEIRPSVIEVSSAAKFPVKSLGEYQFNAGNNLEIATALETTLEQQGVDIEDIVIAGFIPGGVKTTFADEMEAGDTFHDPSRLRSERVECVERLRLLEEGLPEEYPGEAKLEADRIAQIDTILQKPNGSFYYFAPFTALQREGGLAAGNPIDYAKANGILAVYDRRALLAVDPNLQVIEYGNWEVIATPEEIESAKLLTFKPRYVHDTDSSPHP